MGKYVMVVQSQPRQGRDAEYNSWYDSEHYADICSIPGVIQGRRFEATQSHIGEPGLPYLAIFDIDCDDPSSIMAEMGGRAASGRMNVCDALDAEATRLWFYKLHEVVPESSGEMSRHPPEPD